MLHNLHTQLKIDTFAKLHYNHHSINKLQLMLYLNMKMRSALLKAATLIACATSLNISAIAQDNDREVFYRVHSNEFNAMVTNLNDIDIMIPTYIIAAPNMSIAMPNYASPSALPYNNGTSVELSDDCEELYGTAGDVDHEALKFRLQIAKASEKSFFLYQNGKYLCAEKNTTTAAKFNTTTSDDVASQFVAKFSQDDDGLMALRNRLKSDNGSFYHLNISSSGVNFVINTTATEQFSIYRLDAFNMSLDSENMADNQSIEIKLNLNKATLDMHNIHFNYILNNGEDVTIDDLLMSDKSVEFVRDTKNNYEPVIIPTDGNSTTVWVLPVFKNGTAARSVDGNAIPVGRIFKGVFAENGGDISTGAITTVADDENAEAEYFTIQGQRASQPLAPGLYIKRQGSKTTKIFVK